MKKYGETCNKLSFILKNGIIYDYDDKVKINSDDDLLLKKN